MNNYLNSDTLNNIENKISELYDLFLEKYGATTTNLRPVNVNDDLSMKTLYLSFPHDLYDDLIDTTSSNLIKKVITVDNDKYLAEEHTYGYRKAVIIANGDNPANLYAWMDYSDVPKTNYFSNDLMYNYYSFKMSQGFGKVKTIDTTLASYQYIKIKDRPDVPLSFIPKSWSFIDIPYMQDFQRLEDAIDEIASMWYMPYGYTRKEWLSRGSFKDNEDDNKGLACKAIRLDDLTRMLTNIDLLKSSFNYTGNIWNFQSTVNYNEETELVWDDYNYSIKSVAIAENGNYLMTEDGNNITYEEVFVNGE